MNTQTKQTKQESRKESWVDTLGNVTYPLVVGGIIDYASGLRGWGIVASRTYATGINFPTGAPYGKWRNLMFKLTKTNKESSKTRKYFTDLLAFNTFHVPLYSTVIAVGSLVSNLIKGEVNVDLNKVEKGAAFLSALSPFIGPTMGMYMDGLRKVFKLKSAPEKANDSTEDKLNQKLEDVVEKWTHK